MTILSMNEISQLSVAERIQLVQDIWDSIWSMPESLELTEAQKDELDRRLEHYRQQPETSIPWEDVKQRIRDLE
ncbi:MAG: addiction module protein [Chloroflexota bacterium]